MRVLITGGTGFIGRHLARRRLGRGDRVWATFLTPEAVGEMPLPGPTLLACDVRRPDQVEAVVAACRPQLVFHLAAQTYIDRSWADPADTLEINVGGTARLLDTVGRQAPRARVLIAGSSAEYGLSCSAGLPLSEGERLAPLSPYGVSKLGQDELGRLYHQARGRDVVRARIFNTIGPGKQGDFLADFCQQVVRIESGESPAAIEAGNLDSRRDLTDVEDTVAALDLAADHGQGGEAYNISSGRAVRIGDVLDLLLEIAGVKARIEVRPEKLRPAEEPEILGDASKLEALTGWRPGVPFAETLARTLEYWRDQYQSKQQAGGGRELAARKA